MDPSFTTDLTLDEFRFLVEMHPPIRLPASLAVGSLEGSSTGADDLASRRASARATLEARKLLATLVDDDEVESRHPLFLLALVLPLAAQHVVQVQSWTPRTSSESLICVRDELASFVTISLDRSAVSEITDVRLARDGVMRIEVGSLELVSAAFERLFDGAPPEPEKVEPLTLELGLIESRSIIAAIQAGQPAVLNQVAALFTDAAAVPLLRSLATSMEAGVRIRAFDRESLRFSADWVQSSTGEWVGLRLLADEATTDALSPQFIVDNARMELTRRHRNLIGADIVTLMIAHEMELAGATA